MGAIDYLRENQKKLGYKPRSFKWQFTDFESVLQFERLEIAIDDDDNVWSGWFRFEKNLGPAHPQEYELPVNEALSDGKTYYWGLRLTDHRYGQRDVLSPIYRFTVRGNMPPTVTLREPPDGMATDGSSLFKWGSSDPEGDHISHDLYVDDDPKPFDSPMYYKSLGSNTSYNYRGEIELSPGTYWGVLHKPTKRCIKGYAHGNSLALNPVNI